MLENIKISEGAVIAMVSFMGVLYVGLLFAFVTKLKSVVANADRNLVAALDRLRKLMNHEEIHSEAARAYSEVVKAYKTYRCVQRATSTKLIFFSTVGVVILSIGSLLAIGYSKTLSLILMGVLILQTVVMLREWLVSLVKSGTSIIRFKPEGSVTEDKREEG